MTKISYSAASSAGLSRLTSTATSDNRPASVKPQVIFFGNGPLADAAKSVLAEKTEIIFHARSKSDLETVKQLKLEHPTAHGILASFGVLIKSDLLEVFEPEGILNIHPSLLPDLRGASPIESAILRGDTTFGVSIMKLVAAMDAGPIFYQTTLDFDENTDKFTIYRALAEAGVTWLADRLSVAASKTLKQSAKSLAPVAEPANALILPPGAPQDDSKATFCGKLKTAQSELEPALKSARTLHNEVRAFAKFPKSRYTFFGRDCIIHATHISDAPENQLSLLCSDGKYLCIDTLQPANKRIMSAKDFLNGYAK